MTTPKFLKTKTAKWIGIALLAIVVVSAILLLIAYLINHLLLAILFVPGFFAFAGNALDL